jgi:hypothetical protein
MVVLMNVQWAMYINMVVLLILVVMLISYSEVGAVQQVTIKGRAYCILQEIDRPMYSNQTGTT